MPRLHPHALSAGLVVAGVSAWVVVARPLVQNPDLAGPVNPLGIDRSPYGEVLAMAMQAPIDTYFHASEGVHECGPDCDHDHAGEHHACEPECDHDHDHAGDHHDCEPDCDHDHGRALAAKPTDTPLRERFRKFVDEMGSATVARTNPKPVSPALNFYLRRKTEDKLRFAYELDPSHYGNYNSYHFFLTHHELGTRPQLTQDAAKLAQETIDYCLTQQEDPRPALTAAAAAENILELLIQDFRSEHPRCSVADMRRVLAVLDHCLARHHELSKQWDASGNWELLSDFRRQEIKERLQFVTKVREADVAAITGFDQPAAPQQASH